ncbi:FAD-binding oxidoreductase [Photobacterium sp. TY1-4]|uniref:FAD-binding oxidoreductase n=1 Tax=Photobacterium sp. TY1-4 TaxID=2899122 RepID=UPI0021C0E1F2|nr:FAD-binding oxidoreductase [Photobacterium sp. TY1-4]UXI03962.1 FAD-binding oxidoreductase [Photobacterium sp. TY1-4]
MELRTVLSNIFAASQISQDPETLHEYSLALNGSLCTPSAVVWPEQESELIAIVEAANQHRFTIHPVAQGKNWGYGTAQGTHPQQVIVNLSRLSQVLEINDAQAYVRIQPGITQSQLFTALQNTSSSLQMDITAAGLHTSMVGNILERGFGHTDYSDRFGHVQSMRVLLPTGKIITTGMGMFEHSVAQHLYPYGAGPVLQGLFSQSNLGIVLEMTLALQPKPAYQATVFALCPEEDDAPDMVATIGKLKLEGVITSGVHTVSMTRAMGEQARQAPGAWILTTSLAGPKGVVKARYKHVKQTLKQQIPGAKILFLDDFRWRMLCKINRYLKSPMIDSLKLVLDLKLGVPSDAAIQTLLDHPAASSAMKTSEFPANFRWICAVSSHARQDISEMLSICRRLFREYGYEERYSMTNVSERAVVLIANIRFGKSEPEIEKATRFHQAIDAALLSAGFCPYRSGSGLFDTIKPFVRKENLALLATLKQSLDPNNILSPDKYLLTQPDATKGPGVAEAVKAPAPPETTKALETSSEPG